MEEICSRALTPEICFDDFIINSLDSLIFLVLIFSEVSIRTLKPTAHIGNNLLLLLILIILSYFTSISILLLYLPTPEVSMAEILKFTLQIML